MEQIVAKKRSMFTSRKEQNDEATQAVLNMVEEVLPNLMELDLNREGIELVGISVRAAKSGDGFLCVTKLRTDETRPVDAVTSGLVGSRFVVYGFGDSPLEAVCNVEGQLKNGTASLVEDKYPD